MNLRHAHRRGLLTLLIALALTSCNDEVFVDDFEPSSEALSIDGSGASATLSFQTAQLRTIGISTPYNNVIAKYYSADDRLIHEETGYTAYLLDPTAAHTQPAYIEFLTEDQLEFKVALEGNNITITEIDNPFSISLTGKIELEYNYKYHHVNFSINPEEASAYIITGLTYDDRWDYDFRTTTSRVLTYTNSTPTTSNMAVLPGQIYPMRVQFELKKVSILFTDEMPEVEIPTFPNIDDVDGLYTPGFYGVKVRFSKEQITMPPLDPKFQEIHSWEVPPYSTRQAVMQTEFAIVKAQGKLHAVNSLSGREINIPFTVKVLQPFQFKLNCIDLPYAG